MFFLQYRLINLLLQGLWTKKIHRAKKCSSFLTPSLCASSSFSFPTFYFSSEMKVTVSYSRHSHLRLKFFVPILSYLTVNCVFPNLTDFGVASLLFNIYVFLPLISPRCCFRPSHLYTCLKISWSNPINFLFLFNLKLLGYSSRFLSLFSFTILYLHKLTIFPSLPCPYTNLEKLCSVIVISKSNGAASGSEICTLILS